MVKNTFSSRQNSNEVNDKLIEYQDNEFNELTDIDMIPTSPPPAYDKVVKVFLNF